MKLIYIGYIRPESEYQTNKATSFAAGRFEKGLLKGLLSTDQVDVSIMSIEPKEAKFPRSDLLVHGKAIDVGISVSLCRSIGYVNFPFVKQTCLWCSLLARILIWAFINRKEPKCIISYNADVPIIQVGLLAEKLNIKYLPVIADLPFYDEGVTKKTVSQLLSSLGYQSQFKNLRKLKRAVVLNENAAKDFGIPSWILMEGAVTENEILKSFHFNKRIDRSRNVLYCGSLDVFHGSDKLYELCQRCKDVEFHICGRGKEWEEKFKELSTRCTNLHFYGPINNEALEELQSIADLMIIPHPSHLKQLRYQFPSKLMTCMSTGIPVLSTPIPGITEEYRKYINVSEDASVDCLEKEINEILGRSVEELSKQGRLARDFVVNHKNWNVQAERIVEFLR